MIRSLAVLSLAGTAFAAEQTHEECERRIQSLEQRVEQLEGLVRRLADERQIASVLPEPQVTKAVAPTPVPERKTGYQMPAELIPDIGTLGAQVGILLSGSSNPYHLDAGTFGGGFIDLPLFNAPRWMPGKVSYELMIGMSNSKTVLKTTSNVAQIANLAVLNAVFPHGGLQNVADAAAGTGAAPFAVKTSTETRLRLMQVVPFALKYTSTSLDRWRLRPYATLGFGTYVTIHDQNPARGKPASYGVRPDANLPPAVLSAVQNLFGGTSPFGAPLVAGQLGQSPELEALGLPSGHGNIDFGIHGAVGTELRLTRGLSLGFDARFNRIASAPGLLTTYGTRLGIHF